MNASTKPRRIEVLHFCHERVRGGAEEHMLLLLRKFDRSRFRLHLVCPPELVETFGSDLPADIDAVPLMLPSPLHAGAARRLAGLLHERRIDVVHSHMFRASLAASPIAKLCGVPVTIETAHVRENWRKGWRSSYLVDRLAGRFVTHYIAVSQAIAGYLTAEKRLPRQKITVIQNGCDVSFFHPAHAVPAGLRASLGFSETDPVLVVAARLEPQKGHRFLLQAMPQVLRDVQDVKVVCIGDGQLRQELAELNISLGLERVVHFVGHQSNVRDWLALADFTVLPSLYEGLPLTALESLAAGRTIVATAVDGTPEVVVHGKTGLTVPPANVERLGDAIRQLLMQPCVRQKLAAEGRRWVEDHFSQDEQVRQTADLYLHALHQGTAARTLPLGGGQHDY